MKIIAEIDTNMKTFLTVSIIVRRAREKLRNEKKNRLD